MTRILEFIAAHMGFLWRGGRFRIVDSVVSGEFSGALLHVESESLRLRFISDRGELSLAFQPSPAKPSNEGDWYSAYRVRRLMTGERRASGVLDESDADFIGEHLDKIEEMFSAKEWPSTEQRLRALGEVVARELFG